MNSVKKTTEINSLKIAYLDNEVQSDKTLVFIHGNSMDSKGFKNQFNSSDLNKFRLLALDFPGHGNSEKTNSYSVIQFIDVISSFCSRLKLQNFIIAGHSLGGHFAMQSLPKLVGCNGAFIFGAPPIKTPLNLDEAFLPHPVMPLLFKKDLNHEDMDLFAKSVTCNKNELYIKESIKTTDSDFREQLVLSIQNGDMVNEVAILKNLIFPIALLCGKNDVLVNTDYIKNLSMPTLWQNKLILIEDASHCPHLENPEVLNKLLVEFTKFCNKIV
tara:strand:- start:2840 stop:3655 length:816 start_codon:yes stop_codon:yes gene_type:complete